MSHVLVREPGLGVRIRRAWLCMGAACAVSVSAALVVYCFLLASPLLASCVGPCMNIRAVPYLTVLYDTT